MHMSKGGKDFTQIGIEIVIYNKQIQMERS